MKKLAIYTLFLFLPLAACLNNGDVTHSNSDTKEYRAVSGEYTAELKSVLMKNMKAGGPIQAVGVCSDTAYVFTGKFSVRKGMLVKRVSLKNRNVKNYPDEFEQKVLNEFESMITSGELSDTTEVIKKTSKNGKSFIRYMKPILVEAPCLNCHGDNTFIQPDVAQLIKTKYPDDKAIDYKIGELRGAISITKQMN